MAKWIEGKVVRLRQWTSELYSVQVEAVFDEAAVDAGLSSSGSRSMSMNNTVTKTLEYKGGSKTLNVQVTGTPGNPLMVQVAYTEKK